jgi:hypothetical protein
MAEEAGAFGGGSVAGTNGDNGFVIFDARALGGLRNADERGAEVAFDVRGERFNRRDVEYAAALRFFGDGREHQAVDAPEEGRESFAGAGGRENQSGIAASDGGPAERLRLGGAGENGFEPIANRRVKKVESVCVRCGRRRGCSWFGRGRGFSRLTHRRRRNGAAGRDWLDALAREFAAGVRAR